MAKPIPFIFTTDSNNIAKYRYDANKRTLDIVFRGNPKVFYRYYNVSPARYKRFQESPSKGTYFHINIKEQYKNRKFTSTQTI